MEVLMGFHKLIIINTSRIPSLVGSRLAAKASWENHIPTPPFNPMKQWKSLDRPVHYLTPR
jgi:hypothetical protein